jgi:L,D-peptidoglycan transpeptidase YkuD (ErfK/YbiS/YcfS/YnhG family)
MRRSWHTGHMAVARIVSSCAVVVAVAGCTALAIGMSRAASAPEAAVTPYSIPTLTTPSDQPTATPVPRRAVPRPHPAPAKTTPAKAQVVPPTPATASTRASARKTVQPPSKPRSTPVPSAVPKPAPKPAPKPVAKRGQRLPIAGSTAGATRVITVTASSYGSTIATLQPWVAAPGGGWLKHGGAILAHVGSDGVSTAPSETRSATPVGSFSLTQAFGAYSDPGTALPYFTTNSSDWWISQAGSLYNTHQHCASGCGFTHGAPNEHLAYELPYYRYAVVIDYNTRNAPGGVRQGRGSAFFLHVTDGNATAGCVAISQAHLVSIMKWLTPAAHPRILIGVA